MLISISFITGKDRRPFFDLWILKYGTVAANQVASFEFTPVKKQYCEVPDGARPFKTRS